MGWDITFKNKDGNCGSVHFAGMAAVRQTNAYGICFYDCITYGPDGNSTEVYGAISAKEGGRMGWWRPRVSRCIDRATMLLAAVREKPTHPLDDERCAEMLRLLTQMKYDRSMYMTISY